MKSIKNIRLKEYDYTSNSYYFVTICTNYRRHILTGHVKSVVEGLVYQYAVVLVREIHGDLAEADIE